jgi:hypothetical protein
MVIRGDILPLYPPPNCTSLYVFCNGLNKHFSWVLNVDKSADIYAINYAITKLLFEAVFDDGYVFGG